uniref:Uncharacterized protein n=1 Tax=Trichogramma kaykai TaxID=54128 RepID=A0ABD2VW50_9HYME
MRRKLSKQASTAALRAVFFFLDVGRVNFAASGPSKRVPHWKTSLNITSVGTLLSFFATSVSFPYIPRPPYGDEGFGNQKRRLFLAASCGSFFIPLAPLASVLKRLIG